MTSYINKLLDGRGSTQLKPMHLSFHAMDAKQQTAAAFLMSTLENFGALHR